MSKSSGGKKKPGGGKGPASKGGAKGPSGLGGPGGGGNYQNTSRKPSGIRRGNVPKGR